MRLVQKQRRGRFELASGGTLFLDEIGELPLSLQAKLLRALESGEIKRVGSSRPTHVDVRVLAATNRDLAHGVAGGSFRQDAFERDVNAALASPDLRERLTKLLNAGDTLALVEAITSERERISERVSPTLTTSVTPGTVMAAFAPGVEPTLTRSARSRLTRSPVLIRTGQAVWHMPSTAQVSITSYSCGTVIFILTVA